MRSSVLPVALLSLFPLAPAFAGDGDLDVSFNAIGRVTWTDGGSVTIADVAVKESSSAGYAVGTIDLPTEAPALHWKGFNRGGGDLDQGCAEASANLFPFATSSSGHAGIVDSSGNLVVGGSASFLGSESTRRALVARFDLSGPGCDLDSAFSSNGWAIFDDESWCDTEQCDVLDLVEIRPETGAVLAPRIVALVRSTTNEVTARLLLLGLTGSGAIDTGFDGNGWTEVADAGIGTLDAHASLAVDAVGRLYILAARYDPKGSFDLDAVLFRYQANGALDATFGTTGGAWPLGDDGPDDDKDTVPRGVAVSSNGYAISQIQYDADSAQVISFLNQSFNVALGESSLIGAAVTTQGNGRIVAVGEPVNGADGFTLERWLLDPDVSLPLDDSFGDLGFSSHDLDLGGSNSDTVAAVALWAGRIVVAGYAANGSGTSGFLLRTQNSYVFADGFDQGTAALWSEVAGFVFPE